MFAYRTLLPTLKMEVRQMLCAICCSRRPSTQMVDCHPWIELQLLVLKQNSSFLCVILYHQNQRPAVRSAPLSGI